MSENIIILPTAPLEPLTQNPSRLILYGPPKVGKTTFAAELKNNLIIDLEKGARSIKALKYEVNSLQELGLLGKAIKEQGKPYKYLTIDTASKLEDWCEWAATDDYMRSIVGKNFNKDENGNLLDRRLWESVLSLSNGGGYLWLRLSFSRWIDSLSTLADHIILMVHLKDKVIEKQGKEVSAKDIDLTGRIKAITCASADAIGYMYRKETDGASELRINFNSREDVICGARPAHLKGADIPADWSKIFVE